MTVAFDIQSVERMDAPALFARELPFPVGDERPSSMKVEPVSVKFARPYIAKYHYLRTMPDSTLFCFAGFYGRRLAGIAVFGMGGSKARYTSVIPSLERGAYCELTRLWCPDSAPKNTESKLIAAALSQLPQRIKLVLSYADEGMGHVGTIYRATNWLYLGKTEPSDMLKNGEGKVLHPRLVGIYRMRRAEFAGMKDAEIIRAMGFSKAPGSHKHKFAFLRFGRLKNRFLRRALLREGQK